MFKSEQNYKLTLSKHQWMICRAFAYGMTYAEMALFFGVKYETIKEIIKVSRKKLKKHGYIIYGSVDMTILVEKGIL